jgi:hypothetical protein
VKRDRSGSVIGLDWLTAVKARIKFDPGGDQVECGSDDAPGESQNLGLRAAAIVSGDRGRVGVARAGVSSGTPITVVSPRLAQLVTHRRGGERRCARAPWASRSYCGPSATVDVAVGECVGTRVEAIVTNDLPRGVDVVVGRDALSQVREIQFGPVPPEIVCRRRRRGWL